jgi:hypothetical protein
VGHGANRPAGRRSRGSVAAQRAMSPVWGRLQVHPHDAFQPDGRRSVEAALEDDYVGAFSSVPHRFDSPVPDDIGRTGAPHRMHSPFRERRPGTLPYGSERAWTGGRRRLEDVARGEVPGE